MLIKTFPVGPFQCNCSIIIDRDSNDAIIVDPGAESEKIIHELNLLGCSVKYLVHTHAHVDHVGATKDVSAKTGGKICLHKGDSFLYENLALQAQVLGLSIDSEVSPVSISIEHADEIEFGNSKIKVIHTPGHTPGSVCFLLESNSPESKSILFSGDTLFKRSIGRTDLWGGDHSQILSSIKERLFTLDSDVCVVCGHGQNTSIGEEIKLNRFFN